MKRLVTIIAARVPRRYIHLIAIGSTLLLPAVSQTLPTTETTNGFRLYPISVQREADLALSLFDKTNNSFDQKVYDSVRKSRVESVVVSYQLVSLIFYYPTTNGCIGSATELGQVDELLCSKDGISRRAVTNAIPTNYIRVCDPHRKHVGADVDVLLGVAPSKDPTDVKYFRRSFRFTYHDGWKQD